MDRHLLALRNFAQQIPTPLTNVAAQYRKSSLATWYQLAQQGGGGGQVLFSIIITGALVSIIPVIVVFLLLQRFWQGGLTAGAIK